MPRRRAQPAGRVHRRLPQHHHRGLRRISHDRIDAPGPDARPADRDRSHERRRRRSRAPPGHRLSGERRVDGHHQGDGSLYDVVMTRVGIVAKSHLRDATPNLTAIEAWLAARGHYTVFETATAALMPP